MSNVQGCFTCCTSMNDYMESASLGMRATIVGRCVVLQLRCVDCGVRAVSGFLSPFCDVRFLRRPGAAKRAAAPKSFDPYV
jgi:hypothetical protein